jgi:uncharacterized iron-regulated membrane protein
MVTRTRSGPSRLYATIWRWHFYAGLFVIPFILTLALSGATYLFKPQIDRWEERAFDGVADAQVAPHRQVSAALAAHPGSMFLDYRLPERPGDAGLVRVALPEGAVREVFVSSGGAVMGELDPDRRIMAVIKRIHSQLLIGEVGNRLVELAACWAIVMILSGLYLWWPRDRIGAGVVWPRLKFGKRAFWRDLHAVAGFWVSSLALVLLVSGLPWAGVWGPAFAAVRAEQGWVKGAPSWEVDSAKAVGASGQERHHHAMTMPGMSMAPFDTQAFDRMVARAAAEKLVFPAIVTPPGAPGRFDAPGVDGWTMRSDAADVPLQTTVRYDVSGGMELSRERFEDSHPIDRAIGYGIAWHTGQLFGWVNQLIGVLTALGLITVAVSGFVMWRRRKPGSAPPKQGVTPKPVVAALVVLGLLLPLFGASLLVLLTIDRLVIAVWKERAPTW